MRVKVLCGDNTAKEAFEEAHLSSGHRGQKATREAMSLRFYWPGMSKDINLWVSMLLHFPYTLLVSQRYCRSSDNTMCGSGAVATVMFGR